VIELSHLFGIEVVKVEGYCESLLIVGYLRVIVAILIGLHALSYNYENSLTN